MQFGFRFQCSCETQQPITNVNLARTLKVKNCKWTVEFWILQVFYTVPQLRLQHKLEFHCIRGHLLLNWIKSFLTNHSQQVVIEGSLSSLSCEVTSGVPQGFSTRIHSIYINDITEILLAANFVFLLMTV